MKKLLSSLVLLCMTSVGFSQTVNKVEMAKDNGHGKPGPIAKSFAPGDSPIHCVLNVEPLTGPIVFTATLMAVDAGGFKDFKVKTTNVSGYARAQSIDFKFSLPRPWPAGQYRVDIKVSEKLLKSIAYEIK